MNPATLETIKVWSQFLHPLFMWVIFILMGYALYLGSKARKVRFAEGDEKKELIKGKYNTKHYQLGSVLLATMVMGSIGGMAVTYWNSGKLFVNPHLIVGLVMTGLIAVSAALSPFMQKGKDWARYSHIALNMGLLGLFGWQAITGMGIVKNVISRM